MPETDRKPTDAERDVLALLQYLHGIVLVGDDARATHARALAPRHPISLRSLKYDAMRQTARELFLDITGRFAHEFLAAEISTVRPSPRILSAIREHR